MSRILLSVLLALPLAAACNADQPDEPAADLKLVTTGSAPDAAFVEVTASAGKFTLLLDGIAAPLTVAHFTDQILTRALLLLLKRDNVM